MSIFKDNNEIVDELINLQRHGLPSGANIGLESFDDKLTFVEGGCTDVTGYPFYGKSLVAKEILVALSVNKGWKHCIYMPDDGGDTEVISNLIHKLTGKTFDKQYPNAISEAEIVKHSKFILDKFKFISSAKTLEPKAFWNYAKEAGCNSAVIDSWNYMNHEGEPTKPDYLRKILSYRNRFFETNKMHSFIIIHPKNPDAKAIANGGLKRPSVYDLMGGSEWNNNGKNIMVIHKNSKENHEPYNIHIDKVKPKYYGNIGELTLMMDWGKQRFYEYEPSLNRKTYAYGDPEEAKDPLQQMKPQQYDLDNPF